MIGVWMRLHPDSFYGGMCMDVLIEKIARAKRELATAGPIHSRDLRKYIHRLENELRKRREEQK